MKTTKRETLIGINNWFLDLKRETSHVSRSIIDDPITGTYHIA